MQPVGAEQEADEPLAPAAVELDRLFERLYDRIRRLAGKVRGSAHPTLTATALAHEAYLKLRKHPQNMSTKSYDEVITVFSQAMHQILKDASRRKQTQKRTIAEGPEEAYNLPLEHVLTLMNAMESLETSNFKQAQIVRCRFVLGMTTRETSAALSVSPRTVERELQTAKEVLASLIGAGPG